MTIEYAQRPGLAKPEPGVVTPELRGELDASLRAMPMQRLIGNGMSFADATELHAMAALGVPWTDAASWIGACNVRKARVAERSGQTLTASQFYFYAAAAFRFGQSPIMLDEPLKLKIYEQALDAFTRGARLSATPHDKVAIPYGAGVITGWLVRPVGVARPNVVIIFGGADGWREEYHNGAMALCARGIAALLVDCPGQGETRMLQKQYLDAAIDKALSAVVSFLLADARTGERVGIWGNSLGGNFALRTAAADGRIAACCDNSGPPDPWRGFESFARIIDRGRAMVGGLDVEQTRQIFTKLRIRPEDNQVKCNLLILHGNADRLVTQEEAQMLYESAPSRAKRLVIWDDGDHCIYNHSDEKHATIGDWFQAAFQP